MAGTAEHGAPERAFPEVGLFDTYLVGAAESPVPRSFLSAGMPVKLRAARGSGRLPRFDVWSSNGLLLGKLPPAEAQALETISPSDTLDAEIAALIPTKHGQRVHLRVALPG